MFGSVLSRPVYLLSGPAAHSMAAGTGQYSYRQAKKQENFPAPIRCAEALTQITVSHCPGRNGAQGTWRLPYQVLQ